MPRTTPRSRSAERPLVTVLLVLAALVVAACGTQIDKDRIIAAAGGSPTAAETSTVAGEGGSGADLGAGSSTGDTESSGVASTTPGPSVGNANAPSADDGSGNKGAGNAGGAAQDAGGPAPGAAAGGPTEANLSPVVIGNIGSYSGVLGSMFPGGPSAVQAWAQDVNTRGGLNGHPVQIVSGDDGGDPARALSLARRMVEEQGAIAFMGNMQPLSLAGIRSYLEQNGIPLVGGDQTVPAWSDSPVIFPAGTDIRSMSTGILRLMADNADRLAMLFCGESPSCSGLAAAADGDPPPGLELIGSPRQISIVQTDFTTECLDAKNKNADAIFVAADANTVIRVARSCKAQGYTPLFSTASIAVGFQLAQEPLLDGLIAPINNAPWFGTDTEGQQRFIRAMQTYAGGVAVDGPSSAQFAAGLTIELAAKDFDADPSSSELLTGLRNNVRNATLGGLAPPLTYRNGPTGAVPCYFVVQVRGGRWTAPDGASPKCL